MKSWRWFQVRVQGLLAADTRLTRHFQPTPEQPDKTQEVNEHGW